MQFKLYDLGLVDYLPAYQFQQKIFTEVKTRLLESALIICRHNPVITLGRQGERRNIRVSGSVLRDKGISVYDIERGGDVTYHGPGQLIIYPVFNLAYYKKDIHWFLRQLEEIVIDLLSDFGVKGERITGKTGVWVGAEKICSIGIAIRNWITFHGLSINIKEDDLANFNLIRPCGMDIKMTSLETILGRNIDISGISKMGSDLFYSKMGPIPFLTPL